MLLQIPIRNKFPWIRKYYYFITVLSAGLLVVSSGCAIAWPSPTIQKIRTHQTPIIDGENDVTGIGYLFFIGSIPGFFITWLFLSYIGRRVGMLAASLLYIISWVVMRFATTISWIYGARLLQGMAQTSALTIPSIYIVEISPVSWREVSGYSLQFFLNLGLLIQYSIGPFASYECLLYINIGIGLSFFILFVLIAPETPYYFLMNNQEFNAEKVLRDFRACTSSNEFQIQEELDNMKTLVQGKDKYTLATKFKLILFNKGNRRALLITLGLTYLFVFSGVSQLLMFAEPLLRTAEVDLSPSISCIFIGVIKLCGGFALPFLVKYFGIKKMTVYSTLICSIAMFFLALFYTLKVIGYDLKDFFWAPITLLVIYFFLTAIGIGFILMHVRAEIFPPDLKSTGILIQETVNIISLEICSLFFTQLQHMVYIPLWFFSVSMFVSVIFMQICLPDSRTMTLYDIQKWLNK